MSAKKLKETPTPVTEVNMNTANSIDIKPPMYDDERHYPGHYGLLTGNNEKGLSEDYWYSCRESALNCYSNNRKSLQSFPKQYLLMYAGIKSEKRNAIKFLIKFCEDKLNLSEENRIQFFNNSNKPAHLLIKLSPWWIRPNYECRLSLLTILLRAGLKYKGEQTIEEICKLHRYLKETENAVVKFFDGYTRNDMHNWGIAHWVKTFRHGGDQLQKPLKIPIKK